jgi:pilus assembly protein CpaB
MKGRALTLAVALSMAAVAVASVYLYVGRVESKTLQGLQTRQVLVAKQFLPTGSPGNSILEQGGFEMKEVPSRFVAPGALDEPQDIAGLTLVDDVTAGEQLTAARFASPEQNVFVADLPNGTEALSLPFEEVRGVSGHLQAGDRINAYVTAEGKEETAKILRRLRVPSSAKVFDPEEGVTLLLLRGVLVVEVPQPVEPAAAGAAPATGPTNITLAVTSEQAAQLIYAQEKAALWYTLAKAEGA